MFKRIFLVALIAIATGFPPVAEADPARPYALLRPTLPDNALPGDRAGSSVARDGDWLLIGAPAYEQDGFAASGRVSVYHWESGRWDRKPALTLGVMGGDIAAQANARFGTSLAIDGTRALIGCPGCASPNPKAYLIELTEPFSTPPTWYPLYPALISAPDAELGTGAAVAISGITVAVSAPNARSSLLGVERGAVALGHFDGSAVIWDDIVFGPSNPAGSRFGHALAMTTTSGESLFDATRSLLVGAPAYVNSGGFGLAGRAYLYGQGGFLPGPWDLVREFANDAPGLVDALGWSVAIEQPDIEVRGLIALGAPGRNFDGVAGGSVRIYRRPIGADSDWFFEDEFTYSDVETGDRFGIAIGLAGDRVLVGADLGTIGAYPDRGAAYLFERDSSGPGVEWQQIQTQGCFVSDDFHECGASLTISRGMTTVGHPRSHDERGGVTVFVCDQIFAHALEDGTAASCVLP